MSALMSILTSDMPRDVRIAKAMLEYLSEPDIRGEPFRMAFTMYEEDCEVMFELCEEAKWNTWKKWEHMRSTLSAVASKLADWRYLIRIDCRHNQESMENGEPSRWYAYELPYKYRARLNPSAWPRYKPERTPEEEMVFILWRVFDYEVKYTAEAMKGGGE